MAAEAANIGANFSEYSGNAGAVGGAFGVIEINTKPLQDLAAYTFTVNKVKYDQAQKDAEANAKRLADLTAYDLNTAIPKDREIIQKGYDELYSFVRDNPTVLDYKNNQKGWMEYNKKKNDFENKLQGGKARSILYMAREKEVADEMNPSEKARLKSELDKEANDTDLQTPLKHTNKYNLTPIEVKAPNMITFDVTKEGQNIIAQRSMTIPDMSSVVSQAQAGELGLLSFAKDPNTSEYKAQFNSGKLEPVESAKNISSVLMDEKYNQPQFRNEDGTVNIDAVIKDNEGNALVAGNLNAVKQYNAKMQQYKKNIRSGYYTDKFKAPISFGGNGLNESDFAEIDISDGLQPAELLKIMIMGLAKGEGFSTKVIETDDANQAADREAANYRARLNEEGANMRAKFPYIYAKKTSDSQTDEDILNANSVLSEVSGIINAGRNPSITNKFFGDNIKISDPTLLKEFSSIAKDGKTNVIPTTLEYDNKTDELVMTYGRNEDGDLLAPEQRVNAQTYLSTKVKQKFPNRDIGSINSIISSIFNKEGNLGNISKKYGVGSPADPNTTSTTTKTRERSTTATKQVDLNTLDPNGFKKEGNYYRYKDGTLFDGNGNVVNK